MRTLRTLRTLPALLLLACADAPPPPKPSPPSTEVEAPSTSHSRTPPIPEVHEDAEALDLGVEDAELLDVDLADFGVVDAEVVDLEVVDAEILDSEVEDVEVVDAILVADAEALDSEVVDAEDAEVVDSEILEPEESEAPEVSTNEIWLEIQGLILNPVFEIREIFVGAWQDDEYDWMEVLSHTQDVPDVCYLGRPEINREVFVLPQFAPELTTLNQQDGSLDTGFPVFNAELMRRGVVYLYCVFGDGSYSLDVVEYELPGWSHSIHFDGELQCICPSSPGVVTECAGEGGC